MSEDLLWSVKNGEVEEVKKELKKTGLKIDDAISGGRTCLHFASDYGQTDVIGLLLDAGASINIPDKHGITPLLAAIWENHKGAVELLLSRGANTDGKSPEGQDYIDCAETDEIKLLLKGKKK